MSLALYGVGYLAVIAVVSYLAHRSHIPEGYILAMAVILLGIGVMNGVEEARRKRSHWN